MNIPAQRAVAATLLLFIATLASGSAASPMLPLLAGSLVFAIRFVSSPVVLAAPVIAAVGVLITDGMTGGVGVRSVGAALVIAVAAAPGWFWRREYRRTVDRLTQLDDILTRAAAGRAAREATAAAAEELEDLERALASVAARIQARNVILWDVDAWHGTARARVASHQRPTSTLRLAGDALGWAWDHGMRLRLEQPPRWADPAHALVADRLRRADDYGLMVTYAFVPDRVPADELPFDETAVYLRGLIALQDARAFAAAGQRRVHALLHGLKTIPGELDLAALTADLCVTAMAITDATGAAVGVWDGEEGRVLAVAGEDGGPRQGDPFHAPESELGLAIRADTMLVRDAGSWSLGRTAVAHDNERWISRPRALAALPLRGPVGAAGVLAVWSSRDRVFDPEALELLHALSPYAALHIEHARAFGRMRETAERDPLTQLRNRRAFDDIFAAETVRFERYTRPLSLLVLDLDHFKTVNDRFGHEAGDEVLRRFARALNACIRDIDTAARLGGEEFVVLLPETDLNAALDVAERIRSTVAEHAVDWRGTPIEVRVSIGASCAPRCVPHPSALMSSADAALYKAKAEGRNRVVSA